MSAPARGGNIQFIICIGVFVLVFFLIIMFMVRGVNKYNDHKDETMTECLIYEVVANEMEECKEYKYIGTSQVCGNELLIATNDYDCYDIYNDSLIYNVNDTVNCHVYDCDEQMFTIHDESEYNPNETKGNGFILMMMGSLLFLVLIIVCVCRISHCFYHGYGYSLKPRKKGEYNKVEHNRVENDDEID